MSIHWLGKIDIIMVQKYFSLYGLTYVWEIPCPLTSFSERSEVLSPSFICFEYIASTLKKQEGVISLLKLTIA
ncbi:MAG: hypothetical protein COY68_04425 [Candidatus Levybacteria bacterium CG_4_10_14_0_8_um_filter_35_23]|nr:MAG: hypothetical protein COY68_04425 [Candidatus Levybacteria bacterium CG_4_10_14_0_8_um_filter_35_23]PJC54548.1 MAG: hypothetical protein CO028_01835 [Candidatus Levybacteria bacterium CG_4_9_14_0_2_um_filter_35_21]